MPASTVTSKGQITIPVEVRNELDLKPGSRIDFVPLGDGSYQFVPVTGTVMALRGAVPLPPQPVTLEEMDTAIAEAAADTLRQ